jgi:hypothetical protein
VSVIDSREIREKAVPELLDDAPLQTFEREVWLATRRVRLTPLEMDLIVCAHERAVNRAIAVANYDEPPGQAGKKPRRVVPW